MKHCTKKALRHLKRVKAYFFAGARRKAQLQAMTPEQGAELYLDRGDNYRDIEAGRLEPEDFRP